MPWWPISASNDLRQGQLCTLDRKLLSMASSSLVIDEFIQSVVYDHAIATGLKSCVSDQQIVDYAVSQGFLFPLSEWEQYVSSDAASLSDFELEKIRAVPVEHWSWAFRKTLQWRAMLMDGA